MSKKVQWVVGIDEAGRGPAMGPMVYALAAIPVELQGTVAKAGANDSKKLTHAQRESILKDLKQLPSFEWRVNSVTAPDISESMNGLSKNSLNQLAFEAARSLLVDFAKTHDVSVAYIDLISPAEQYRAYIAQKLPNLKMIIEAKADATYPITGAASIVAKVTRDAAIKPEWGCGYPSDQTTIAYLNGHCDKVYGMNPKDVRLSWAPCLKIMEQQCVGCTWHRKQLKDGEELAPQPGVFGRFGFCK